MLRLGAIVQLGAQLQARKLSGTYALTPWHFCRCIDINAFVCRHPDVKTDRGTDRRTDGRWTAAGASDRLAVGRRKAAAIDCRPEELHCTRDQTLAGYGPRRLPSQLPSRPYRMCALRCMIFCWFSVLAMLQRRQTAGPCLGRAAGWVYGPV